MTQDLAQKIVSGTSDSILLAGAAGGRSDVRLTPKKFTLEQLFYHLSTPKVGQKDGSYFIRGGDLVEHKRADENLRRASLAIIDGDSRIDPETGEILPGAPPYADAIRAMEDIGCTFIAYHSYSCRPAEGFWKYRIVVPVEMARVEELQAVIAWLLAQLHARGVLIADVRENGVWSQPWYFPRTPSQEALTTFDAHMFEGEPVDLDGALAFHARLQKNARKEETLASQPPVSKLLQGDSVIESFNKEHGLSWVRSTLEAQGYRFGYFDKRANAYRYTRPGSETGVPGVVVFQGAKGDWCVFSHHSAQDPLSGKLTDPFALYATFSHGGDLKAAARALKPQPTLMEKLLKAERPTTWADVEQAGAQRDRQEQDKAEQPTVRISATPFVLVNGADIPPREWLYGKQLIRKFASATISPGGIGKSSLTIVEALAMVTGRKLLHDEPRGKSRVWLWNGEDPTDELQRRFAAACKHYRISSDDIAGRLFVDTGREQEIVIARRVDRDVVVVDPVVDAIIATVKANKIDCIIIDPFVSSHRVSENANEEIDRVAKAWNRIANETNTAIQLVHHSRKTPNEVTVDDARGASALRDSVRSARALNGMSEDEAAKYTLDERWRYFRATNGKANLAPRSDDSLWFRMESVPLNNGDDEHEADVIGVVTPFTLPGAFDAISGEKATEILIVIDRGLSNGQRYALGRGVTKGSERNAIPLVAQRANINEEQAKRMLQTWLKMGVLVEEEYDDPVRRKPLKGLSWDRKKTGDA